MAKFFDGLDEADRSVDRSHARGSGGRPADARETAAPHVERFTEGPPAALNETQLLALQHAAGNGAVGRLMHANQGTGDTSPATMTVQRMKEPAVTHPKLANLVRDLYKGAHMKRGRVIGDGSTADAIRGERRGGGATKGVFHEQKGYQYVQALTNWLNKRGPNGGMAASEADRVAAQALIDDLNDALTS